MWALNKPFTVTKIKLLFIIFLAVAITSGVILMAQLLAYEQLTQELAFSDHVLPACQEHICPGPAGASGQPGPQGLAGPPGKDGQQIVIVAPPGNPPLDPLLPQVLEPIDELKAWLALSSDQAMSTRWISSSAQQIYSLVLINTSGRDLEQVRGEFELPAGLIAERVLLAKEGQGLVALNEEKNFIEYELKLFEAGGNSTIFVYVKVEERRPLYAAQAVVSWQCASTCSTASYRRVKPSDDPFTDEQNDPTMAALRDWPEDVEDPARGSRPADPP